MTTTPDLEAVREIAKAAIGYAIRQCRVAAVEAALLAGTTAPVLGREFDDLSCAAIAEYDRLAAALSWPDEQPQDERDGDVPCGDVTSSIFGDRELACARKPHPGDEWHADEHGAQWRWLTTADVREGTIPMAVELDAALEARDAKGGEQR